MQFSIYLGHNVFHQENYSKYVQTLTYISYCSLNIALTACFVPGSVLGVEETAVNELAWPLCSFLEVILFHL